mmetsp:Transcript_139414/g.242666  ORF Transcript_139414/g.242666 Transcript_139414/m.242666 type:complete len:1003 (-) Transcript_139414:137-3145(-)
MTVSQGTQNGQEVLQKYSQQFSDSSQDCSVFITKSEEEIAEQWPAGKAAANLRQNLIREMKSNPQDRDCYYRQNEESDGEEVRLCHQCRLPLGDAVYNGAGNYMHGECWAQFQVKELREKDEAKQRKDREEKALRHKEYDIGWRAACIPRNAEAASKLACRDVPQGMVCLVLDESTQSVRVAATMEPAASVNLEYLSTALKVRAREGHEPYFSLDMQDASDNHSMQKKVFEPEWLAGTSVGDVLFQSDYHLKELSMGEYEQPIVGMKSCFDYSEMEGHDERWAAREWFMIRKAEVQLTDSNVLLPYVKMGVEAREQRMGEDGMEDCIITREDHPMVKYAEEFTRNFDLIAERKSVIFHLRELAKASVLAKFLVESGFSLEESWFHLASPRSDFCSLTVPQLWNERIYSQIRIQEDGEIENAKQIASTHGVYGGVQFGLDRMDLLLGPHFYFYDRQRLLKFQESALWVLNNRIMPEREAAKQRALEAVEVKAPPAVRFNVEVVWAGTTPRPGLPKPERGPKAAPPTPAGLAQPMAMGAPVPFDPSAIQMVTPSTVERGFRPTPTAHPHIENRPGGAPSFASLPKPESKLKGVDLRLDDFDLSEVKRVTLEAPAGSWNEQVQSLDACVSVGDAFWASIDDEKSVFKAEDKELLRDIFNPRLSDRRMEGDCFVPPDASHANVTSLRNLVKEEDWVRQRRQEQFFSKKFVMDDPGPLFPSSWKPSIEIARGREPAKLPAERAKGMLHARPDYKVQLRLLGHILQSATPVFDKSTEEGLRFRIYRIGTLEVRTTQEPDGKEDIGIVYSVRRRRPQQESPAAKIGEQEKIVKVTEYVERISGRKDTDPESSSCRRYYLVLETEKGHKVVTEQRTDGHATWQESAEDLEDRNSLAKVLRLKECSNGITVQDYKHFQEGVIHRVGPYGPTRSACKRYVRNGFALASGVNGPNAAEIGISRPAAVAAGRPPSFAGRPPPMRAAAASDIDFKSLFRQQERRRMVQAFSPPQR